ncbi:MAG: AraC family transcriptional regulator [Alphaproteobacteria bacterium]|nr:hypothetical protein [Hyphomonas sp.]MBR9807330.1 AraC family transcriptional regulator [Alphaproteobacteria bacterium]|tara:strand:- start:2445 stop:3506 length:1062 start_codon:yes stop_codon:yes gene_type:complete
MAQELNQAYFELHQIEPILSWAEKSGVDIDAILARLGIDAAARRGTAEARVRIVDYYRIQREIARLMDDLTAQLSERKLLYQTGPFVVTQMRSAVTLMDAIRSLASHFNMMHGGNYNNIRQNETTLTLVVDDASFPYRFRDDSALTHFIGDALLIKTQCLLESISNGTAGRALKRVVLKRDRQEAGKEHLRFWQVPISYGHSAYELVYDIDVACEPITPARDVDLTTDGLFDRVIRYLEELSPTVDTRSYTARTEDLIADGYETQQAAASQLGISVATYRRRLSEENTSFRDILQESRARRAGRMLAQGESVAQVSEKLGYSDVRAFNRAFKKSRGLSPAAFMKMSDQPVAAK